MFEQILSQVNDQNMSGVIKPVANVFILVGLVLAFFGQIPMWGVGATLVVLSFVIDAKGV
jgi:hypothetical protein